MERVTGIGGFFFVARDPDALSAWYERHLGILPVPTAYDAPVWRQDAGTTVFAPMPPAEEFFGGTHTWAINFRVPNLDAMLRQLREAGIAVEPDEEVYPNGRFASLRDPEGNLVQLWEPSGSEAD